MEPTIQCGPYLLTMEEWEEWRESLTEAPPAGTWVNCLNDEACARSVFSFHFGDEDSSCSSALLLHSSDSPSYDSPDAIDIINCLNNVSFHTFKKVATHWHKLSHYYTDSQNLEPVSAAKIVKFDEYLGYILRGHPEPKSVYACKLANEVGKQVTFYTVDPGISLLHM